MPESFHNYIRGEWVAASTGETFADINPADRQDIVGTFQSSNRED